MRISNYSFDDLPFSKLFKTYVNDFPELNDFYETNPFDESEVARRIKRFEFDGNRQKSAEILAAFNRQFEVRQETLDNLERLKENEQALAIVTGQQMGVYGGPLYTILKIVSTLHIAEQLEDRFNRPVIPVFWLADEDHDYDEVRSLNILNRESVKKIALPAENSPLPSVAEIELPDKLEWFREQLKESLYETDFSDDLWKLLDETFVPGRSFLAAFGTFISKLFSKHGLVLAGSNFTAFKRATSGILQQSITKADEIRHSLEEQSEKIGGKYHQQATLYDSNLFYLDDELGRTKISRNGDGWGAGEAKDWETSKLLDEIAEHPEKFSPNVFMRPVLQDTLLPTLGYVAGPGETAYYGQMKQMYSCFGLTMPVIYPRLSGTMIEPAIDRILGELPFEFHEYNNRIEDLESDYVDRTEQIDIEAIFSEWKEKVEQLSESGKRKIADVDPTLKGAVGNAKATYFGELDKLKGKVYRAVKKQDETQLKRIRRIKANLFPEGGLQERCIAGIFFMNKYGIGLWDELLTSLEENEQFDHHKLIYL